MMQDRFVWTKVWSEERSRSYGPSEDRVQAKLDQSGLG
jgi:hypothetical protein